MTEQQILKHLKDTQQHTLGSDTNQKLRYFFAPGRVNLIGEHTDYNGGNVFPCAINIGTYASVSTRHDKNICVYSLNFPHTGIIKFSLDDLVYDKNHSWANYPKGVIKTFSANAYILPHGLDICFYGNLPNNSGLSSSASIEVLTGFVLNNMFNFGLDNIQVAKLGKIAENDFIGVNCGIMDQFAVAIGRQNHAILLNCQTLDYKYAKLNLDGYKIIIGNTNKLRSLASSKYNERHSECQQALACLQQEFGITELCQLNIAQFEKYKYLINNPIWLKRAKHAIHENERTILAEDALNTGDLLLFGNLLNQSHVSLRDDYEVTGHELDVLVAAAWQHPGCIGSRMTGAGFGGCTVSLVKDFLVNDFIQIVGDQYLTDTGIKAKFYIVTSCDGVKELIQ
jgi:galactokinase